MRDYSPGGAYGFRMKNNRIRWTVSRKIKNNYSVYKRHLAFSEASERRNHSEVLYLNLLKKTTTCAVAKPLVSTQNQYYLFQEHLLQLIMECITLKLKSINQKRCTSQQTRSRSNMYLVKQVSALIYLVTIYLFPASFKLKKGTYSLLLFNLDIILLWRYNITLICIYWIIGKIGKIDVIKIWLWLDKPKVQYVECFIVVIVHDLKNFFIWKHTIELIDFIN